MPKCKEWTSKQRCHCNRFTGQNQNPWPSEPTYSDSLPSSIVSSIIFRCFCFLRTYMSRRWLFFDEHFILKAY